MACRLAASSTISTRAPLPPRSKPANLCSGCLFRLTVPIGRKEPSLSAAHFHVGSRGRSKETRDERSPDVEFGRGGARCSRPRSRHRFRRSWPLGRWDGGHGWHGHWHGGRGWGWHGGRHWHGRWGRGWGWGWGPRVYVGPLYGRCWAPGYDWVPCRRWWW